MIHVYFKQKRVSIKKGNSLLQAARQGRVALRHRCGGKGSCTTCKVIIHDQQYVSLPNSVEQRMLGKEQLQKGVRLGCQTRIYGDVSVDIMPDPLKALIQRKLMEQNEDDW